MGQLGAPEPAHTGSGVLQAQGGGTPDVAAGGPQLLFADALVRHLVQLAGDEPHHLLGPRRRGPGVDGQVAGTLVTGTVRVHVVGQPPLLPDDLEQPARHAPAEHVVDHVQHLAVRVVAVQAGHADHDVSLLRRPLHDEAVQRRGHPLPAPAWAAAFSRRATTPSTMKPWSMLPAAVTTMLAVR